MSRLFRRSVVIAALTFCLPTFAADTIATEGAWTRATPPGAVNSAAYVQLHNSGKEERTVVSATSEAAEEVQLHTVIAEDGLMKMRQVPYISVPAGGVAELKPGGYHIMLLGVTQPLRDGESVDIELEFADGEKLVFASPIKKMAGGMDHSKMDHSKMKHD